MKTTIVCCLVIAISVLAVTESSKRNSTGRYKQFMSFNLLHAWVYGLCSLCQVCRGSCISIRFSRPPSNLVIRAVLFLRRKRHVWTRFFGRINWLFVAWLLNDLSLKKCVLVMVTHFPLKCVMVVSVDYVLRFNRKNNCRSSCRNLYPLPGHCKIHLVWPRGP